MKTDARPSDSIVVGLDMASGDDVTGYCMSRPNPDGTLTIIECGRLQRRMVRSAKRARKLRRRGECVLWDMKVGAWTWDMRRPF